MLAQIVIGMTVTFLCIFLISALIFNTSAANIIKCNKEEKCMWTTIKTISHMTMMLCGVYVGPCIVTIVIMTDLGVIKW